MENFFLVVFTASQWLGWYTSWGRRTVNTMRSRTNLSWCREMETLDKKKERGCKRVQAVSGFLGDGLEAIL